MLEKLFFLSLLEHKTVWKCHRCHVFCRNNIWQVNSTLLWRKNPSFSNKHKMFLPHLLLWSKLFHRNKVTHEEVPALKIPVHELISYCYSSPAGSVSAGTLNSFTPHVVFINWFIFWILVSNMTHTVAAAGSRH